MGIRKFNFFIQSPASKRPLLHSQSIISSHLCKITIMPRQGDGSSDNGPFEEATHDIGHGVTSDDVSYKKKTHKNNPLIH